MSITIASKIKRITLSNYGTSLVLIHIVNGVEKEVTIELPFITDFNFGDSIAVHIIKLEKENDSKTDNQSLLEK